MQISQTPLRITLGGGGTDLPAYYESSGEGFLIAAAITKYIFVTAHDNFADRFLIKYSRIEDVEFAHQVEHPLVREALILTQTLPGIEITSMADIPSGTGLGSSGTFAVGLLKALRSRQMEHRSNAELAAEACHLEIDVLGEPVGKQDQYIAALGGVTSLTFLPDGQVLAKSIDMSVDQRQELEEHLLLFYTGMQRRAADELSALQNGVSASDSNIRANLDRVRDLGYQSQGQLELGNLDEFGRLLSAQWFEKLTRSPTETHKLVDSWINEGVRAGAMGGKLIGAGGGGFLLFLAERKSSVRAAMRRLGLREVHFRFDYQGSRIIS